MIQNPIIAGKKLPELTNPAGAANIESGYEAIDGSGNKITGTKSDSKEITNFGLSSFSNSYNTNDVVVAPENLSYFVGRFFIAYVIDGSTLRYGIAFLKDLQTLITAGDTTIMVLDGGLKITMDFANVTAFSNVKIFTINPIIS